MSRMSGLPFPPPPLHLSLTKEAITIRLSSPCSAKPVEFLNEIHRNRYIRSVFESTSCWYQKVQSILVGSSLARDDLSQSSMGIFYLWYFPLSMCRYWIQEKRIPREQTCFSELAMEFSSDPNNTSCTLLNSSYHLRLN